MRRCPPRVTCTCSSHMCVHRMYAHVGVVHTTYRNYLAELIVALPSLVAYNRNYEPEPLHPREGPDHRAWFWPRHVPEPQHRLLSRWHQEWHPNRRSRPTSPVPGTHGGPAHGPQPCGRYRHPSFPGYRRGPPGLLHTRQHRALRRQPTACPAT